MLKRLTLAMGLVAAMATTGSAAGVYGTAADLTGARSGSDQIGYHASLKDVNISWNIVHDSVSGLYHYNYAFDVGKKTDAVFLEFGADAGADAVSNLQGGGYAFGTTIFGFDPGQPSLYGITVGLAADPKSFTIQFDSDRAPVWGNVYIDGQGNGNYAYNMGLTTANGNSSDTHMFIATPGGAVPEPSSIALLGCGAIGLAGVGLRRRKARRALRKDQ